MLVSSIDVCAIQFITAYVQAWNVKYRVGNSFLGRSNSVFKRIQKKNRIGA